MPEAILIVEDDEVFRAALRRYLKRSCSRIFEAGTVAEARAILEQETISLMLSDVSLPDGKGFELVDKAIHVEDPPGVIVMTGESSLDNPINAIHAGAADFLLKPFSFEALDDAMVRATQARMRFDTRSLQALPPRGTPIGEWRRKFAPEILGNDKALMKVFSIIERVADTDCSVLITGQSGTGKEGVAHAVHAASDRADQPFVTVNCAAIPENLLESELFGHIRGAFTGATQSRVGRFAQAHGGTVFLDEIGEMPVGLQAKFLRVLQEKEVTPVGDSKTIRVDVRVVAATNRDLDEMVDAGQFREDLLYRLNVIPVELPPLCERRGDIPELVEHFVQRTNERRGRQIAGVSDEAMEIMAAYEWPGNIRQLANTIERLVVLKSQGFIDADDLPRKWRAAHADRGTEGSPELPEEGIDLKDAVEKYENALILQALERTGWNKNQAAQILRMNRTTLVEKLKKKNLQKVAS
ncbi:MAG: sigma-54-dependent Fis family transcriptional regulator [Deltaproteobacteria bacterium]|nr:sigma-54-dependent Fis family transcriptional regulator [Deltaproteobacteria bacterium]